jgi:IS5 family transposase
MSSQISFADLEFHNQGVRLEPMLQAISDFIDKHGHLVDKVRRDLQRGLNHPETGRNGLSAQQVLRSLVLQRVKNWNYRELRERINDGYTLRRFTRFYSKLVPKHDAFNRAFNRLTPATLEVINELVVKCAVALGLENGKKLRVDTTVVETDIHHPMDSTLLWDTVRVVTRLIGNLDDLLPQGVPGFTNRSRSARRRMQEIHRMTPKDRTRRLVPKYRELIRTTEQVPNEEKIFSIFETHTDLIKRGKILKPVEFGHKVYIAESAHGLITQYRVLDGNPRMMHTSNPL